MRLGQYAEIYGVAEGRQSTPLFIAFMIVFVLMAVFIFIRWRRR